MKIEKKILIIAGIIGLITAGLIFSYLLQVRNADTGNRTNVVVARKDIPANTVITADMVSLEALPAEAVIENSVRNVSDVVGSIAKADILSGEQILKQRLAGSQGSNSLSYTIPEQYRAITIAVNEISGIAGYVSAGDKVDILISFKGDASATYTQLQNITVFAVGSRTSANKDAAVPASLTLLVTPSQAEVLTYGAQNGTITLTLRNPVDKQQVGLDSYGDANFNTWKVR